MRFHRLPTVTWKNLKAEYEGRTLSAYGMPSEVWLSNPDLMG